MRKQHAKTTKEKKKLRLKESNTKGNIVKEQKNERPETKPWQDEKKKTKKH